MRTNKEFFDELAEKMDELFPKGECQERGSALVLLAEASMLFNKHTFTQPKESKCPCACHDNILKKPYGHDTKCCDEMNGYMESEEKECDGKHSKAHCHQLHRVNIEPLEEKKCKHDGNIIDRHCTKCGAMIEDKGVPSLPEELDISLMPAYYASSSPIKSIINQGNAIIRFLKARG